MSALRPSIEMRRTRSLGDIFVLAERLRLVALLLAVFLLGLLYGYAAHAPEPDSEIDYHAGDVDQGKMQEQWMAADRFHWFWRCPKPYKLWVRPDLSDPESDDTSEIIATCE